MKGMILAAGFGTRLAPQTDTLPKALVSIAGTPMIRLAIDALLRAGCDEIIINAHHFAEQVEDYFRHHEFGVSVHVLRETDILGTGGGLLNAASLLEKEETFLLYNADIACEADLTPLWNALEGEREAGRRPLAALLVNRRETRRALLFDARMRFMGKEVWMEQGMAVPTDVQRLGFCGVHAVSGDVFRLGFAEGFHDIFDLYRRGMEQGYVLTGVETDAYWTDLGTLDRIAAHEQHRYGGVSA
ncbi:MAG: NTP transferase domain-containing protein [Bacteroidetes bacterium]|nr:NTP transferase domain-containing protein [Bacteroidota bacterium]